MSTSPRIPDFLKAPGRMAAARQEAVGCWSTTVLVRSAIEGVLCKDEKTACEALLTCLPHAAALSAHRPHLRRLLERHEQPAVRFKAAALLLVAADGDDPEVVKAWLFATH